jgi:hypothetical protein
MLSRYIYVIRQRESSNAGVENITNVEDVEKLAKQIEELTAALENAKRGGGLPPAAVDRINRLSM